MNMAWIGMFFLRQKNSLQARASRTKFQFIIFLLLTPNLQVQDNWKGNKRRHFYSQTSQIKIQSPLNKELAVKHQMALKCIVDKTTLTLTPQFTTDTLSIPKIRLQMTERWCLEIKITFQQLTFTMSLSRKQPGIPPNIVSWSRAWLNNPATFYNQIKIQPLYFSTEKDLQVQFINWTSFWRTRKSLSLFSGVEWLWLRKSADDQGKNDCLIWYFYFT